MLVLRFVGDQWRHGVRLDRSDQPDGIGIAIAYSDDKEAWTAQPSGDKGPLYVRIALSTSDKLVTPTLFSIKPAH